MPISIKDLKKQIVPDSFSKDQVNLVNDGFVVLKNLEELGKDHISDYSFVVAPFAKAYEGFLKDFFLRIGLISQEDHASLKFRVGKVLNPNLRHKDWSVYAGLEEFGGDGKILARALWKGWKMGRNRIFHYFPGKSRNLSIDEAKERIDFILRAVRMADNLVDNSGKFKG